MFTLNVIKYIISALFIIGGSILGWYKHLNGGLDVQDWVSTGLLSFGGMGYLLYPMASKMKMPSLKAVCADSPKEEKKFGSLAEDRESLDHLMKVGMDYDDKEITESMIKLNTEIFKIRHQGKG